MSKQKRKNVDSLMNTARRKRRDNARRNTARRKRRDNARRWLASNRCSDRYDYDYCERDATFGGDAGLPIALRNF